MDTRVTLVLARRTSHLVLPGLTRYRTHLVLLPQNMSVLVEYLHSFRFAIERTGHCS